MEYEKMCREILEDVGGKENISDVYHCITRLRVVVKDLKKVDFEKLKKVEGLLTVKTVDNQVQCVVGPGVDQVYQEFCEIGGFEQKAEVAADPEDEGDVLSSISKNQKKATNPVMALLNTLSAVVTPSLYGIIAGGMLKGLSATLTATGLVASDTAFIQVLDVVADAPFYFMPFFIAYAAAKRFKINEAFGLMMAGVLMYPTILNKTIADTIYLFGVLPIPCNNYKGTIFPALLSVWFLSVVFHFIDKRIHKRVRVVFSGMLSFLIAAPISLIVFAPIGNYIATVLTNAVYNLYQISGPVAGFVFGAIIPLTIIFGIKGWSAIELNNLEVLGYDFMLPNFFYSNLAVSGATLAASRKIKSPVDKANATSTGLLAILGITEPALYGIGIRYKTPLYAAMIGGGCGGCVAAILGVKIYAFVMPGITSIAAYFDSTGNFFRLLIAMAVSWAVSFAAGWIMTRKDAEAAG